MPILVLSTKFDETDQAILNKALDQVEIEVDNEISTVQANLPRMLALKYVELLRLIVLNQRYSGTYAAYTDKYRAWKFKMGKPQRFWELGKDLVTALQVFTIPAEGVMGGVPDGIYDKGKKSWYGLGDKGEPKPIAMYGNVMEYGLRSGTKAGKHPARPLFRPAYDEFVGSAEADAESIKSLLKVEAKWR